MDFLTILGLELHKRLGPFYILILTPAHKFIRLGVLRRDSLHSNNVSEICMLYDIVDKNEVSLVITSNNRISVSTLKLDDPKSFDIDDIVQYIINQPSTPPTKLDLWIASSCYERFKILNHEHPTAPMAYKADIV